MIQSMTGYGRGEKGGFTTEVRSFNHRFLDISIRLPKTLSSFETSIKKIFQNRFSRGRFDVSITRAAEAETKSLALDKELAHQYYKILDDLRKEFNLKEKIDLELIASMKDLITLTEVEDDSKMVWRDIEEAIQNSIAELIKMRREEGEFLIRDLFERVVTVEQRLDMVEARCPRAVQNYREKLLEKVRSLTGEIEIDEKRLYLEIAIFAERCDIAEEIVRVRSHLGQFRKMADETGPIGKKLDFLLQEIGREVNTIGSKAGDAEISQEVVEIKGELERLREQVQNIE